MNRVNQADYVLPLRWENDDDLADLSAYLWWLSPRAHVIVVDGSPPLLFRRHAAAWAGLVTHVAPRADGSLNGKVVGVHTGLALTSSERVVIADDDVRYDEQSLRQVTDQLDAADLVGPQNVFVPMPWHAAWDTARTLLNRSVASDYPGTFAVRRSTFVAMGGYDGNVLFENLELMRTVRSVGGRVRRPRDVYVARRPPTVDRFLGQRVRQAFDDLAQPWRLAAYLPVLPLLLSGRRGRRAVGAALVSSVALAELGRRRAGGAAVFPARASLLAPAWVLERSVCAWLAVGQRVLLGGVRYGDQRLRVAAHSRRALRRRAGDPLVTSGRAEGDLVVRAVAEGLARGAPAPTQRDRAPAAGDLVAIGVRETERTADEQRPVLVGRDHRIVPHLPVVPRVVDRHTGDGALGGGGETECVGG